MNGGECLIRQKLSRIAAAGVCCIGMLPAFKQLPQPLELVVVLEVDRDLAAALGRLAEIDLRAERRAEFLFERGDLLAARLARRGANCRLRRRSAGRRRPSSGCDPAPPARWRGRASLPCRCGRRSESVPVRRRAATARGRGPARSRPSDTICFTSGGSSNRRIRLATVERSTLTRAATSSCVQWY